MGNIAEFIININRLLMLMPIGYKVNMYSMEEILGSHTECAISCMYI